MLTRETQCSQNCAPAKVFAQGAGGIHTVNLKIWRILAERIALGAGAPPFFLAGDDPSQERRRTAMSYTRNKKSVYW